MIQPYIINVMLLSYITWGSNLLNRCAQNIFGQKIRQGMASILAIYRSYATTSRVVLQQLVFLYWRILFNCTVVARQYKYNVFCTSTILQILFLIFFNSNSIGFYSQSYSIRASALDQDRTTRSREQNPQQQDDEHNR